MKNREKREKIAAVVITHNRKELLKECLDALLKQTRPLNSIIIMNNASTDNTEEMLKKEYLNNPVFDYVNLGKNLGGAGGFHFGMKRAYEKGFDWVWCMDDDTIPDKDALKELVNNALIKDLNSHYVYNSLVKEPYSNRLSFLLVDLKSKKLFGTKDELKTNELINGASFFNGTLIPKFIIGKCGFPKKELFIWRDEVEYFYRLISNGFKIVTVTKSIVLHSAIEYGSLNLLHKRIWYAKNVPVWKKYYEIRNRIYIQKKYNRPLIAHFKILGSFFKNILMVCLVDDHKLKKIKICIKGFIDGLSNKWGKDKSLEYEC